MEPVVDQIQITVPDVARANPFYDRLIPLLGFDLQKRSNAVIEEHEFQVVEQGHPHLALRVESRAEVDRLHGDLAAIGVTITDPSREYPEYTPPGYYALFFK